MKASSCFFFYVGLCLFWCQYVHGQNSELVNSANQYLITLENKDLLIKDNIATSYLDCLLEKLNEVDSVKFSAKILNTVEVNASCLSNKTILVTAGLLLKMNSEEELAFILSHEISHYLLGHVFEDRNTPSIEYEADSMGLMLFNSSGYKKKFALNALKKIPLETQLNWMLPDFIKANDTKLIRTHPRTADRINKLSLFKDNLPEKIKMDIEDCNDHEESMSNVINKTRFNILEGQNNKSTLCVKIAIIDSIVNNQIDSGGDIVEMDYLLLLQSDYILTLINLGKVEIGYHIKFAEAYFNYRVVNSSDEQDFFSFSKIIKTTKSNKIYLDYVVNRINSNIRILSKSNDFKVESLRLEGLLCYFNREKMRAKELLTQYFEFSPTYSRRRYAKSILDKI